MFKNSSKLLFLITLISGTLIAVSSNSWLSAWMGLEINLLSFIPLMMNYNNLMSSESSLKYFLTQALASTILLFSVILMMFSINMNWYYEEFNMMYPMMINSCLLLKMGAAPFHFWFPGVMEGLNWTNNFILMTWQKIAPLTLISYFIIPNLFSGIIFLSILIGSLGGLNQTSLRKIMAFSSINHLGWLLAAMMLNENLWEFYFLVYIFLSFSILVLFDSLKIFHVNQTFFIMNNNPLIKFLMFMLLLSLGGLPPFLGFVPKWLVIQFMTMNNHILLMIIMVCLTLITLYYYIRICYASFLINYWEINWFNKIQLNPFKLSLLLSFSFISMTGILLVNFLYLLI
uniref:NADH-ubiquinone oxidoreductase chain 2 n=1 Tax=Tipula cockerelliana TaxID=1807362 RepID=A0A192U6I8_9DIPT|nr:NADH dehydrogenase subunit 2 [Tipula cockerelliana]AMN09070.1 NADH dehydrogenase subunit 2 [Tipula cockerelliana]